MFERSWRIYIMSLGTCAFLSMNLFFMASIASAQSAAEGRQALSSINGLGFVAVPADKKGVHLSWQYLPELGSDFEWGIKRDNKNIASLSTQDASSYIDKAGYPGAKYELSLQGEVVASATSISLPYFEIPLQKPADRLTIDGQAYSYTANDASIGDLDGDGVFEIVLKWSPTNAKDNAFAGYTGQTLLDAYRLDGTRLWQIDLGPNIRAGAHYTHFIVIDMDNDGKDELVVKTADGTQDGAGKTIGDPTARWVTRDGEIEQTDKTGSIVTADGRLLARLQGRIMQGPEYLTVFNGLTGEVISTVNYLPQRGEGTHSPTIVQMKDLWGDGYANRSDRFLASVGYFGEGRVSAVFSRGYYAKTVIAAWDLIEGELRPRWVFDSDKAPKEYAGQGNHQMSIADVDFDGKDEIIFGSMAIDHDGRPLWSADLGHGDALHVADLDPTRPGLERFGVHEEMKKSGYLGSTMIDAESGEILWSTPAERDTGRGICIDITPRHPGSECWSSKNTNLYSAQGKVIAKKHPEGINFAIYWDGDAQREILDDTRITKWDWINDKEVLLLNAKGALSNNGTKRTPALTADIFGDWREELILRSQDDNLLRIYSTPITTKIARESLMRDHTYNIGVVAQNSGYNQPPHLGAGRP